MKKLLILLITVFVLSLSACSEEKALDYSSFEDNLIYSYEAAASYDDKYIVYYYSENCHHCSEVKDDILTFFTTYDKLPFYILEVSQATDSSFLDEFVGTPTIFIMIDDQVDEAYIGSYGILDFIDDYSD